MSLSTSLSNALSGLTVAARQAQVVSSNVANATTEGYGVRQVELSTRATSGSGQGVKIDGIARLVDEALIADRRLADAAAGGNARLAEAADEIVAAIGEPDTPGSLSSRIAEFENALLTASARPEDGLRLTEASDAALQLTSALNGLSDKVQSMREDADTRIAGQVERLNAALRQVGDINAMILRSRGRGEVQAGLQDQRQKLIDTIAPLVPLRQIERDNGTVALYTRSGTALLDGSVARLEFTQTATITADMTQDSGALSGLSIDGRPLTVGLGSGSISGGAIAAEFEVRDSLAPGVQAELDGLARDLIERFEAPGVDPTLTPGNPGLFTDGGSVLDPGDVVGLAGRIDLNAAVDPQRGGDAWRLREGIEAAAETAPGDAAILLSLADALSAPTVASGAALGGRARSFAGQIDALLARAASSLAAKSGEAAFQAAKQTSLRSAELRQGVDTDQEMQRLLLIERYYAANARVIETIDELLGVLTRI